VQTSDDASASGERVPDYEKELTGRVKGLKIGVPANYYYDGATADVRRMQQSLEALAALVRGDKAQGTRSPASARPFQRHLAAGGRSQCTKWLIGGRRLLDLAGGHRAGPLRAGGEATSRRKWRGRGSAREFVEAVFGRVDLRTLRCAKPVPTIAEATPRGPTTSRASRRYRATIGPPTSSGFRR
jgi:Asp-tRNA(Asn)/Glu-tRNA(Gln) amidotransferase A subunit family amidase